MIQAAGLGDRVSRIGKHELRVRAGGKTVSLRDDPPFDQDDDGTRYLYCDYREGFYLIWTTDQITYTGVLVNEQTGAVTPGGERVLFSPDRRAYLISEQPDGLDGSVWKVFSVTGRESWRGYSFMPDPRRAGFMVATLDSSVWTDKGRLTATARCFNDLSHVWQVTLTRSANGGDWDWRPAAHCEK